MNNTQMEKRETRIKTVIYYRCSNRTEAISKASELRDKAKSLGFEVDRVIFDRRDKPPYMLLGLPDLFEQSLRFQILTGCDEDLSFGMTSTEAMIIFLENFGIGVRIVNNKSKTHPVHTLAAAIRNYYSSGDEWIKNTSQSQEAPAKSSAGRALFGYKSENGFLQIDEEEAHIVRAVFDSFLCGTSASNIPGELQIKYPDYRIPSKGQIIPILTNSRYSGKQHGLYKKYPAIVTNEKFLKASGLIALKYPEKENGPQFLFDRIACKDGSFLHPAYKGKARTERVYAAKHGNTCVYVSGNELEDACLNAIDAKLNSSLNEIIDQMIARIRMEQINLGAEEAKLRSAYKHASEDAVNTFSCYHEIPNRKNLEKLAESRANIKLLSIALEYNDYLNSLCSITEDQIKAYFEHLSHIRNGSRNEKAYFVSTLVRRTKLSDEGLSFLMTLPEAVQIKTDEHIQVCNEQLTILWQ